jgi:ABC-2 type transport system ATP-binding protein
LRSIYDVPRDRYLRNMKHFAEILDLDRFLATPVRQLSLGERMRGDFAAAMLHDPAIVYLDEPTIGLDVVAKEAIRAFIGTVNRERGTTVILTTHDLADVERLSRRIVLIDEGTVIYDGSLERLREEYGTHRTLVVTLAESYPDVAVVGTEMVGREANTVRLRFNRREITAEALIRRVTERYQITDVSIIEPDIETIVRRIYVEGYDDPAVALRRAQDDGPS